MSSPTTQPASDSAPPDYVLFIFGVCVLAGIVRTLSRWTFLHHTVIMFGLGALAGYVSKVHSSVTQYLNLEFVTSARLLEMHAFVLPVVILEYVFSMDPRVFLGCTAKAISTAVLDYILTMVIQGAFVFYFLSFYQSTWGWWNGYNTNIVLIWLLIGTLTSVTDTSYVVNTFYKMGSYWVVVKLLEIKRIISLVGACVVYIFIVYLDQFAYKFDWSMFGIFVSLQVFASPLLGWLAAHITIWWIRRLYNDTAVEITIALAVAYLVYYFGTANTVQKPFVSAISVVVYALMLNNQRNCFSLGLDTFFHKLLHILAYIVKTVMFAMIGFQITAENFAKHEVLMFQSEILVTFALYSYCMIARAVVGSIVYPLLRLSGWRLSWQEMATTIFCNVTGTVCIITAIASCHPSLVDLFFNDRHVQYILMFHLGVLAVIRSIIAGTLFKHVLKVLGMRHVSLSRYVAMTDALLKIQEQMKAAARLYKFDRFLADADWDTVYRFTNFENPYNAISRYSVIGPAMNLDSELLGNTRLNLLHAHKISFWRQYEQGLLSLRALRILLEESNLAEWKVTTDSYDIGDQIKKYYAKNSTGMFRFIEKLKNWFEHEQAVRHAIIDKILISVKNVRKRRIIKTAMSNVVIEASMIIFIVFISIVSIIILVYESQCTDDWNVRAINVFYYELNIAFVATFTFYIIMKFMVFRWRYLILFGTRFNISLVIIGWIDVGLDRLLLTPEETCAVLVATKHAVTALLFFHKLFIAHRILRLAVLIEDKTNLLITLMKKGMLQQLQLGYDVGKGYVYCKEDVQQYAAEFIAQPAQLEKIQSELKSSRVMMMKDLATVQKKFSGIVVSVKSQEACRRILNAANELVTQLRKNGRVDSYEADMLEEMIKLRLKKLAKIPAQIEMPSVDTLISKLPWVDGDETLLRFLQFNSKLFNMAEGETVDFDSDPTAGIYVLVSGMIRVNWLIGEPYGKLLQSIHTSSETTILSPYKHSIMHDYMTTGSTFGELALLTETPILIDAVCETTALMYHIQYESIRTALDWVKDPPLEWRMWQMASVRVSIPLLKALPGYYKKMSMEDLKVLIDHGTLLVQHLESEFQDSTNEEHLDPGRYPSSHIVLVHGTGDTSSGDTFVGPIVIPPNSEDVIFSSMLCDLYVLYLVPHKAAMAPSVGFAISGSELSTVGLELSTMKDSTSPLASRSTPKRRGRMSMSAGAGQKFSDLRVTLSLNPSYHQYASPTIEGEVAVEDADQSTRSKSPTITATQEDIVDKEQNEKETAMVSTIRIYSPLSFKPDKPSKSAVQNEAEVLVSSTSTSKSPSLPSQDTSLGVRGQQISSEKPTTLPTSDSDKPAMFSLQSVPDIPESPLKHTMSLSQVRPSTQGKRSSPDGPARSLKNTTITIPEEEPEEPTAEIQLPAPSVPSAPKAFPESQSLLEPKAPAPDKVQPAPQVFSAYKGSTETKVPLESEEALKSKVPAPDIVPLLPKVPFVRKASSASEVSSELLAPLKSDAPSRFKSPAFLFPQSQAQAAPREEFLPRNITPRKVTSEVIIRPWTDAWKYVAPQITVTFGGFEKYRTVAKPIISPSSERLSSVTGPSHEKTSKKGDKENSNTNANNSTDVTGSGRSEKGKEGNINNSAYELAAEEEKQLAMTMHNSADGHEHGYIPVTPQCQVSFRSNRRAASRVVEENEHEMDTASSEPYLPDHAVFVIAQGGCNHNLNSERMPTATIGNGPRRDDVNTNEGSQENSTEGPLLSVTVDPTPDTFTKSK